MAIFRKDDFPGIGNIADAGNFGKMLVETLAFMFGHLGEENFTSSEWARIVNAEKEYQDRIENTVNLFFYGSGTPGEIKQLASPANSKMLLQQDTTGAPYWGIPFHRCFAEVLLGAVQTIETTDLTNLKFNSLGYSCDDFGMFTVDSTGLKVNNSGYYNIHYYVDLGALTGTGSGGLLWIGTNTNQQSFHRRLDGGNNADYADDILLYIAAGEYVCISISQGSAASNSYGGNRAQMRFIIRPISV